MGISKAGQRRCDGVALCRSVSFPDSSGSFVADLQALGVSFLDAVAQPTWFEDVLGTNEASRVEKQAVKKVLNAEHIQKALLFGTFLRF